MGITTGRSRRSLRYVFVAGIAAALAAIVGAAPAFANGGSTSQYSGCSSAWNTSPYGGFGRLSVSWNNDPIQGDRLQINSYNATVNNLMDCGPAGHELTAYKIDVTVTIHILGSSLSSCGVGLPWGFTCQWTGSSADISRTATCTYNIPTCSVSGGSTTIYPTGSAIFGPLAPSIQASATLYGASGSIYTWTTGRVSG